MLFQDTKEKDPNDPEDSDLTLKDLLKIPVMSKEGFVPKKFYLAPFDALGLCYLDASIVAYHPVACTLDQLNGKPTTLIHELNHNNSQLQNLPYSSYYDVELFASFPMLGRENALTFLGHSYFKKFREVAKVIYGFDSDKAFNDILKPVIGSTIEFKRDNLEKVVKQINTFSEDMRKLSFEEIGPAFYQDFFYWIAVGKELNNKNAPFEIMYYGLREPTLLNGPAQTHEWLTEYSTVIEDCARKAESKLKSKKSDSNKESNPSSAELLALNNLAKTWGFKGQHSYQELKDFVKKMEKVGLISDTNLETFKKLFHESKINEGCLE